MQLPPTEVLLTWPTPNYTNPATRGNAVLIVTIICLILSTLVTILRIYTRLRITCTAGLDDVLIIFGLVRASARHTTSDLYLTDNRALQLPWALYCLWQNNNGAGTAISGTYR
jgi:hypothetical protein